MKKERVNNEKEGAGRQNPYQNGKHPKKTSAEGRDVEGAFVLQKIDEACPGTHGKSRVADKAGNDVGNQPIAFKGRYQGLDLIVGTEGCVRQCKKCQRQCENTDHAIAVASLDTQIKHADGQGKECQGLVDVRQRRMAVTASELIGFVPAQRDPGSIADTREQGDPGGQFARRLFVKYPGKKIQDGRKTVDKCHN